MAVKLGSDYLYIGAALGFAYLLFKSSKPVTDTLGAVSGLAQSVGGLGQNIVGGVNDAVSFVRSDPLSVIAPLPTALARSDYLPAIANAIAPIPTAIASIVKSVRASNSSNRQSSTPLTPPPSYVRAQTNIAAAAGLVSTPPPQQSLSQNAAISPFTGQAYLQSSSKNSSVPKSTSTMKQATTVVASTTKSIPSTTVYKDARGNNIYVRG